MPLSEFKLQAVKKKSNRKELSENNEVPNDPIDHVTAMTDQLSV